MLHPTRSLIEVRGAELAPLLMSGRPQSSCAAEGAGQASVLDKPTPLLRPTVGSGNRSAAGQGSVLAPVVHRPLPRLLLQLAACTLVTPTCSRRTNNSQPRRRLSPHRPVTNALWSSRQARSSQWNAREDGLNWR